MIIGAFSPPPLPGLRTTIFPVESSLISKFLSFAKFFKYSSIFSSCLEGLGILVISSKCFHTNSGFKPPTIDDMIQQVGVVK